MSKKVKSLEKHTDIDPGTYTGEWMGRNVRIEFSNGQWSKSIEVDGLIRGINCRAGITVDNEGWVYID